jgi:pimeloyl-ACP methyl ester carboxylesterase
MDEVMKQCILKLYRSAVNVGAEWEDGLKRIPPGGLVLWGEDDPYASASFGARLGERTGSRFRSFPGCGHWWQLQRPDEVAAELRTLWSR